MPTGADFSTDEYEAALLYFQKLGKTAITKPSSLGGSRGVTVGIDTLAQFNEGWQTASHARGASRILVEEYVPGIELRLFVIGDRVAAAAARVQPFIVGDGKSTVDELVEEENRLRNRNFRHRNHPLVPDPKLSLIHISEPTRREWLSRMPSSA